MPDNTKKVFFHFPTDPFGKKLVEDEDAFESLQHEVVAWFNRTLCETDTVCFYGSTNFDVFVNSLEEAGDTLGINFKPDTFFRVPMLELTDWENEKTHLTDDKGCSFLLLDVDSLSMKEVFPDGLKEAAARAMQPNDKAVFSFINLKNDFPFHKTIFPVLKECGEDRELVLANISHIKSFEALEKWFESNRPDRVLNETDGRHERAGASTVKNKNSKKSHKDDWVKSPLLRSLSNPEDLKELKKLLDSAITDPNGGERIGKDLVNYDSEKSLYIWFEFERTGNVFHGYHLASPYTGKRDKVAENKIPDRLKDVLKYREKLKKK